VVPLQNQLKRLPVIMIGLAKCNTISVWFNVLQELKSLIFSLNIDAGFLGFFSALIMTFTNRNINFSSATTESDQPRIWISNS